YYPAEFYVALLNNQPMGFYSPAVIAGDAKRHGVAILPVEVNESSAKAIVELCDGAGADGADEARGVSRGGAGLSPSEPAVRGSEPSDRTGRRDPRARETSREASAASSAHPVDTSRTIAAHRTCRVHDVRLGLESVKGLGDAEAKAIVEERGRGGPFRGFDDFARRVPLKEEALRNLALVGAFDRFGEPRRALLWRARDAHRTSPPFAKPSLALPASEAPTLPVLSERERVALDYRITGIPTGPQIMQFYREDLDRHRVLPAIALADHRHGEVVRVAGAIVVKQHPETAKGHVFLSLEDETGMANIIIRPATYQKFKRVLDSCAAVVVTGPLQQVDGVISVLATRLDGLDLFVELKSRDWH